MAQFQDLARCLLAAGHATGLDGKDTYLLYTDRSSITCKQWTGKSFGNQALVAKGVRPNSTAVYLLTHSISRMHHLHFPLFHPAHHLLQR